MEETDQHRGPRLFGVDLNTLRNYEDRSAYMHELSEEQFHEDGAECLEIAHSLISKGRSKLPGCAGWAREALQLATIPVMYREGGAVPQDLEVLWQCQVISRSARRCDPDEANKKKKGKNKRSEGPAVDEREGGGQGEGGAKGADEVVGAADTDKGAKTLSR